MSTSSAAAAFFTSHSMNKASICKGSFNSVNANKPAKFYPVSGLQVKRPIQALIKNNTNGTTPIIPSPERQLDHMNITDTTSSGRLLENGRVFRQNFTVRSFEIGSDFKLSLVALMNYLQETSINDLKCSGILANGFGSTREMSIRDLIWVICWSRIEVDQFPSWSDVVQVDTWKYRSRKSGYNRDWHIRDFKTGKTLIRATSLYVMMNMKTRKYAKYSEEVVEEIQPFTKHCDPIIHSDTRKFLQIDTDYKADYISTGLVPGWTDMDINQHVNHIKLVYYLLKSIPCSVPENHELSAITLEYRKECNGDSLLESVSRVVNNNNYSNDHHFMKHEGIEFDHLLRLERGQEIVRGRTTWKPKYA